MPPTSPGHPSELPAAPRIWGIADLHLSFARLEKREVHAARWREHTAKIESGWRASVARTDLVLIPGDISMARNHRDLQPDLEWLDRLPGTKILSAGNHDTWFNRAEAIRPMLRRSQLIVGADAVSTHGVIVCGTLGAEATADAPGMDHAGLADSRNRQDREMEKLDRAIDHALTLRAADEPLYVLWHYPPFDLRGRPGPLVDRLVEAGVTACVYGHIHTQGQWATTPQGEIRGVRFHCVAADSVGFHPIRVDRVIRPRR